MALAVPQWLGVLSLATLVLAVGGPRRLQVPSPEADQAAQLAALHWWRSLKVGELPDHIDVAPEFAAWGRLPVEDILRRLQQDPAAVDLGHDWTLTRTAALPLMVPVERPSGP